MQPPRSKISVTDASLIGAVGSVALFFTAWFAFWFAFSVIAKVAVICILPGIIYIPMRLLVGGSALPPGEEPNASVLERSIAPLFAALLVGYGSVYVAIFAFGCLMFPFMLLDSLLSVKVMPSWLPQLIFPVMGAAFAMGVAYTAIQDVRHERNERRKAAESEEP